MLTRLDRIGDADPQLGSPGHNTDRCSIHPDNLADFLHSIHHLGDMDWWHQHYSNRIRRSSHHCLVAGGRNPVRSHWDADNLVPGRSSLDYAPLGSTSLSREADARSHRRNGLVDGPT